LRGGGGSVVGGRWEVGGGCFGRVVRSSSLLYFIHVPISIYETQLLAPSPDHRGIPFELYILTDIKGYCKGRSNLGDTRMQ